ncbi:MAG: hypothetical protein JW951_07405, partial [Lentisphaerae bacterium]|nr:hypothetical protein [Lentisphaerota bacterium]
SLLEAIRSPARDFSHFERTEKSHFVRNTTRMPGAFDTRGRLCLTPCFKTIEKGGSFDCRSITGV